MAISAETEAIIDRLKAEGQLTRNSGANSIRSVKIQLDRFEGIFNTISGNIAEQTAILRKSMNIQEEAIEAQKRKDDLDEVTQDAIEPPTKPEVTKDDNDSTDKKSKGLFDFIAGAGGSLLGALKPLLIGGAGLFVAYNFAKGFIDGKTGGGFTKFEESMIKTFKEVDWTALGESFKTFASKVPEAVTAIVDFLSDPLGVILAGAGLTAAGILAGFGGGALARGVTRGIIDGVLGNTGRGGPPGTAGPGLINLRNVARAGALGILTGALAYYGDDVKNWLKQQGVPEDWATVTVDSAITIGTFTSLGMIFGPTGALVGAAVGLAYVLGKGIYNWFQNKMAEAERTARERTNAIQVLEDQDLGDITGTSNTVMTDSGIATTAAQRAAEAIVQNSDVRGILDKVNNGETLSQEDINTLRNAFGAADAERFVQRDLGGNRYRMFLNTAMDRLGEQEGDLSMQQLTSMMTGLEQLIQMQPNNPQLVSSFNNALMDIQNRLIEGNGLDQSDIFEGLTPAQKENVRRLQQMRVFDMSLEPERTSSLDARNAEALQQIADAGAGGAVSSVVIGKMGGDTYLSQQTTKMGDQNVADVQVIGGSRGDSNPLSLVG